MPRLAVFVATVGLLLGLTGAWPPAVRAQQDAPPGLGDPIEEIEVEGNQRIEATTVRSYLAVAVGDPFDSAELDR